MKQYAPTKALSAGWLSLLLCACTTGGELPPDDSPSTDLIGQSGEAMPETSGRPSVIEPENQRPDQTGHNQGDHRPQETRPMDAPMDE